MDYDVTDCTGSPVEIEEVADFLASFVADGEGGKGDAEGRFPKTWKLRLHWWWISNPYRRPDSPLGSILRQKGGGIVGFFGFIPHDYILDGITVPSLISTTTFVREDSRDAALGLFLRAHRLREKYHIVDGGPNRKVQAILERTGYTHAEQSKVFLFPVRRRSFHPGSLLLHAASVVTPSGSCKGETGRLVTRLDEIEHVPAVRDPRLRKHVDRDTLAWYLSSGSQQKYFVGWCDERGTLRCYVHGSTRNRLGLTVFVIMDDGCFAPEDEPSLKNLLARIARDPRSAGLPKTVDLIAWPTSASQPGGRPSPFSVRYDSKLFYRLPQQWSHAERHCQPFEGDKSLL